MKFYNVVWCHFEWHEPYIYLYIFILVFIFMLYCRARRSKILYSETAMRKFNGFVNEGDVYVMNFFWVIENAGSYRTTRHTYKLLFHRRTTIIPSKDDSIPRNGFTMMDAEEIKNTNGDCHFLICILYFLFLFTLFTMLFFLVLLLTIIFEIRRKENQAYSIGSCWREVLHT